MDKTENDIRKISLPFNKCNFYVYRIWYLFSFNWGKIKPGLSGFKKGLGLLNIYYIQYWEKY